MSFADRLAFAVQRKGSALVVGLDPVLDRLPRELQPPQASPPEVSARACEAFCRAVLDEVAPYAVAVKPQIAFFEAWGSAGVAAYHNVVREAREAGLLVIGDIKRGDIGSTARAYAQGHLERDDAADAVTLNPWFGTDGIQPFLQVAKARNAGLFIVVRSSNPSAGELQDLRCEGRPVYEHLARQVHRWGAEVMGSCGYSSVGAVVGATAPDALRSLRSVMPRAWFLIPGVGAQGGRVEDVAAAFDERGLGAVVNASRSILYAFQDPSRTDWRGAIGEAARRLRDALRAPAAL